ncbi:isoprenylcysteine carboxylmethyltransferase family protein [Candidatus Micrarchaeota archaeon]|nr:isoprenylcysteine carboxylmethyltransferase family protein [Candidatus Micrarchaeota archaeon]
MEISIKSLLIFGAAALMVGAMLFVPSGTLGYWQAWMYIGTLFVPMLFALIYFLAKDPQFLERRFKTREKEKEQKLVQKLGAPLFLISFLLPAFGKRFGWLDVPAEISIAADVALLLGYGMVFLVFHENSYAGRTVRVEKGQKTISSGSYATVRHPMYAGTVIMFLATPLVLGMYAALIPFLLWLPLLFLRIKNEEEVLKRELKGYKEYCKKVKYRLVPGIW